MSTNKDRLRALLLLHRTSPIDELVEKIDNLYTVVIVKPLEERKSEFYDKCALLKTEENGTELTKFFYYFSEHGDQPNCKMKFEKEKTFSIPMRFKRWMNNKQTWKTEKIIKQAGYVNPLR